eukprot:jgi/Picsp_1/2427/NSC_05888-R1_cysteine proteinases-like protein
MELTNNCSRLYFEKYEYGMKSVMARVAGCALRQPILDRLHVVSVHNRLESRYDAHVAYCRKHHFKCSKSRTDETYRRVTHRTVTRKKKVAVATSCSAATEWNVYRVSGDGRCMFRALVQGEMLSVGGEEREAVCVLSVEEEVVKADELRARICDELLLRREDVEPFLESRVEDYVRCMRMEKTWGGEPELVMAAHVLQRKVVVYMLKSGFKGSLVLEKISEYEPSVIQRTNDNIIVNLPSSSCDERASDSDESLPEERLLRPINLLYSGSCHYDALALPFTL